MMTLDMELARANAEALERALAARREALGSIEGDAERERRAGALAAFEGYTALLREPVPQEPGRNQIRYCFKLVFPDGRWSIDEKQLRSVPRAGDVVGFDGAGHWRVEGAQRVGVRPAGKPPRTFFVCAPAV
jgi:hypothetical protein